MQESKQRLPRPPHLGGGGPRAGGVTLVPFTPLEIHVLLRLIATANDAERTEATDRTCGTWIAQRLLELCGS